MPVVFSCKDCTERHPCCHSECDTYKQQKELYSHRNDQRLKTRDADAVKKEMVTRSRDILAKKKRSRMGMKGGGNWR